MAFSIGTGFWQFSIMPFGFCNAPDKFKRPIETVLPEITWKIFLVYFNDIVIHGKNFEGHLKNIQEVLQVLRSSTEVKSQEVYKKYQSLYLYLRIPTLDCFFFVKKRISLMKIGK